MIDGKKLVVVTPAGRRRYMELLKAHVLADLNVDEWRLWANTTDQDDLKWMQEASMQSTKVKVELPTWQVDGNWSIGRFFAKCDDPDTVYVRIDDDIIWIEPGAISGLARFRLKNPTPFLVFGNIFNSAYTSYLNQSLGRIPISHGTVRKNCMDETGWGSGDFAVMLHWLFLNNPEAAAWRLPDLYLPDYHRHSINVIAWDGKDADTWCRAVPGDEEEWLSRIRPMEISRPCLVSGSGLFVHYAFFKQRDAVDSNPNILRGYSEMMGRNRQFSAFPEERDWLKREIMSSPGEWVVEIGCFKGVLSASLAEACKASGKRLLCIDPWNDTSDGSREENHLEFLGNIHHLFDTVVVCQYPSESSPLPDGIAGNVGLVFVDGLHTGDQPKNDAERFWPLLAPGGMMAWHDSRDIGWGPGVSRCVSEFCQERGLIFSEFVYRPTDHQMRDHHHGVSGIAWTINPGPRTIKADLDRSTDA